MTNRDYVKQETAWFLGLLMAQGVASAESKCQGYEVTSGEVVEAYDRAKDAAARLNKVDEVTEQVRQLVESNVSASVLFVRQSLHGRMRAHLSPVNEM